VWNRHALKAVTVNISSHTLAVIHSNPNPLNLGRLDFVYLNPLNLGPLPLHYVYPNPNPLNLGPLDFVYPNPLNLGPLDFVDPVYPLDPTHWPMTRLLSSYELMSPVRTEAVMCPDLSVDFGAI